MMRLDRFLGECGAGTRSEIKKMIKKGQVSVNGRTETTPDHKIDENADQITLNGVPVVYEKFGYFLLHKPAGYLTATEDRRDPTVMELLPETAIRGLAPVGRLDKDTEGLLLLTNDGQLAHHLLSPSHHVDKSYYAILDGPVPQEALQRFAEGVDIGDDKPTLPAKLVFSSEDRKEAVLTIHEGRFHQVKRMFETQGTQVIYLKRLSMGSLTLGDLPRGACRRLTEEEVQALKNN